MFKKYLKYKKKYNELKKVLYGGAASASPNILILNNKSINTDFNLYSDVFNFLFKNLDKNKLNDILNLADHYILQYNTAFNLELGKYSFFRELKGQFVEQNLIDILNSFHSDKLSIMILVDELKSLVNPEDSNKIIFILEKLDMWIDELISIDNSLSDNLFSNHLCIPPMSPPVKYRPYGKGSFGGDHCANCSLESHGKALQSNIIYSKWFSLKRPYSTKAVYVKGIDPSITD